MYVAKNPFRTGLVLFSENKKGNDDQTWDEQLIFDLTNNTEIDSSLQSNVKFLQATIFLKIFLFRE